MDVQQQQLASVEQEIVLDGLARSVARPGCRFLEVGSWCGHSSIILAKVAQRFGGQLVCVDWWKGNAGTELADIAAREDIYSLFWQRICAEGLQDVVIPIRGPATLVARLLRADSYQLVFLDADHTYSQVQQDIQCYAPLVHRRGGILCGHDCEGRIADYGMAFLNSGREVDYHESVHCGVVCAVNEAFPDCSINHSIWSVRAVDSRRRWAPTDLTYPGIIDKRQAPPPPIGAANSHNLLRYGRRVYVVPQSWADFDVTNAEHRSHRDIRFAYSLEKAIQLACVGKPQPSIPHLVESAFLGFNIVAYGGTFIAVAQDTGPIDLSQLSSSRMNDLAQMSKLFQASSHRLARLQVALAVLERHERDSTSKRPHVSLPSRALLPIKNC